MDEKIKITSFQSFPLTWAPLVLGNKKKPFILVCVYFEFHLHLVSKGTSEKWHLCSKILIINSFDRQHQFCFSHVLGIWCTLRLKRDIWTHVLMYNNALLHWISWSPGIAWNISPSFHFTSNTLLISYESEYLSSAHFVQGIPWLTSMNANIGTAVLVYQGSIANMD